MLVLKPTGFSTKIKMVLNLSVGNLCRILQDFHKKKYFNFEEKRGQVVIDFIEIDIINVIIVD